MFFFAREHLTLRWSLGVRQLIRIDEGGIFVDDERLVRWSNALDSFHPRPPHPSLDAPNLFLLLAVRTVAVASPLPDPIARTIESSWSPVDLMQLGLVECSGEAA
jgi:hypothetical protein